MPQLDALRAFAVGLVLFYHFWRPARQSVHFGGIGVRVFFVLSGFLITGLLLHSRTQLETSKTTGPAAIRRFYIRRFLRIFPVYYLFLAIAYLWDLHLARARMGWHVSYLSNVAFVLENAVTPGRWGAALGHLWSLSVEEQFYLVWPWIILFAPWRRLPLIVLGAIAVAPLFRLVVTAVTGNNIVNILPFGCLDTLGLGAYLALTLDPGFKGHKYVRPIGASALWIGLPLLVVHHAVPDTGSWSLFRISVFDLAVGLPAVWLVARAAQGMSGLAGAVLRAPPLQYLGTISYGIYLYHGILPSILPQAAARLGYPDLLAPLGNQTLPFLFFYSAASVVVAAISWHCFEGPINRLKDRFGSR